MAEQPIKPEEIIDPKFLVDAIIKANEFLAVNKELTSVLSENLKLSKDALTTTSANNSRELKEQAALTNQINKELKDLETLKKSAAQTEKALADVRRANAAATKKELDLELSQQKVTNAETSKRAKIQSEANKEIARSEKAFNDLNKSVSQNISVYDALRKKYNDLSRAQIELAVRGRENGKVFRGIKLEADLLRASLDKAEQGAGRFQRNVGNYKSGFDGLGNSVNQLTRELPAFAVSAQTGFLAISNNLPIFFDQLQKIKTTNAELLKEGKKTTSALTQLGGAIFSVGSLLSLGVTLLTLYGKELVDWTTELFKGAKALESITKANDAYNKSVNQTKDDITDLKIQLKVQSGLITENEANLLRNENARTKAVNANKELRKQSIEDLKKELDITDKLLANFGKTRQSTRKDEGGARETITVNILSDAETKRVKQYNNALSEINNKAKLKNQYIQEEYNLRGQLRTKEKGTGGAIGTISKEELIKQRDALDEIRQLQIDAIEDEDKRAIEQLQFEEFKALRKLDIDRQNVEDRKNIAKRNFEEQAKLNEKNNKSNLVLLANYNKEIRKLEAENLPKAQEDELRIRIQQETNRKILEIDKKGFDAQQELNIENAKKTQTAREKIADEATDFEIYNLENQYSKKVKALDALNLKEINDLERQANAKKAARIIADAEEKAELTDNEVEKLQIREKASQDVQNLQNTSDEKIAANRKVVLNQALQFEQQLVDAIAKGSAEQSRIRQESFDKQISDADKNIETQKRLAEKGLQNTLAEEEANKVKLERQKQEEKEREIKRQKALAFFKLFASYAEKDPDTALTKALRDTVLAEAVSAAFIDGTENVGKDKQFAKNKFKNGTDGYVARFDGDERILNPEQNKKIGNLSNEALADLAYQSRMGLLDTAKYAVVQSTDFATKINDSALLQQNALLIKELKEVKQAINDKPMPNFAMNQYHEFVLTTIENGFIKNRTFKNRKSRIC